MCEMEGWVGYGLPAVWYRIPCVCAFTAQISRISRLTMSTDADNKEVSRRMLGGWKMLAKSCDTPGCYMPMLQSRDGQVGGGQAQGGEKTPGTLCAPSVVVRVHVSAAKA